MKKVSPLYQLLLLLKQRCSLNIQKGTTGLEFDKAFNQLRKVF